MRKWSGILVLIIILIVMFCVVIHFACSTILKSNTICYVKKDSVVINTNGKKFLKVIITFL